MSDSMHPTPVERGAPDTGTTDERTAPPWSRPGDLDEDALAVARNQPEAAFLAQRWEQLKTDPDTTVRRQREGMRLIGLQFTGAMAQLPTGSYGDRERAPVSRETRQPEHPANWDGYQPPDGQASS